MEIPAASVVSRQTYDAATLAGPLSNQMAALKAAGAQVVAMATIPAATALAMLPAAAIGYLPQYVVDMSERTPRPSDRCWSRSPRRVAGAQPRSGRGAAS